MASRLSTNARRFRFPSSALRPLNREIAISTSTTTNAIFRNSWDSARRLRPCSRWPPPETSWLKRSREHQIGTRMCLKVGPAVGSTQVRNVSPGTCRHRASSTRPWHAPVWRVLQHHLVVPTTWPTDSPCRRAPVPCGERLHAFSSPKSTFGTGHRLIVEK